MKVLDYESGAGKELALYKLVSKLSRGQLCGISWFDCNVPAGYPSRTAKTETESVTGFWLDLATTDRV